MSSGRKRGRPKRKAQRRAKWQHEQRFTKRTKRQTPGVFEVIVRGAMDEMIESHELHTLLVPDGHPLSPYRDGRERLL